MAWEKPKKKAEEPVSDPDRAKELAHRARYATAENAVSSGKVDAGSTVPTNLRVESGA